MATEPLRVGIHGALLRRGLRVTCWLVPVALWVGLLRFTALYAVDVPYMDSWRDTELIVGAKPFTLRTLWEQHNDHRLVWQKLFIYVWGHLTHWNEYAAAFVPGVLIGIGAGVLLVRALRKRPYLTPLDSALLIAALAPWLLSLRQWENLLSSFQICFALVFLAFVLFSEVFVAFATTRAGVVWLGLLVVLGSFSCAQGLILCFFVLLRGGLAVAARQSISRGYALLSGLSAAILVSYFIGYHRQKQFHGTLAFTQQPSQTVLFVLRYLGSPFSANASLATWAGAVVAGLLLAAVVVVMKRQPWAALWLLCDEYPLLVIGVMTALVIMIGRVGLGVEQAGASRYVSFSALLLVSTCLLMLDLIPRGRHALRTGALATLLMISTIGWCAGYRDAAGQGASRRLYLTRYRDCVLSHPDDFSVCDGAGVHPNRKGRLIGWTAMLKEHQLTFFRR